MTENEKIRKVNPKEENKEKNIEEQDYTNQEPIDIMLENIPKEERHEVKRMIGLSMQMGRTISPEMELMKKMTPQHVTEFLEAQKEEMQNQFKEKRETKIFLVVILLIVVAFIIILISMLKDKPDIMEKVLYASGGLIAGALGGYGFGKSKRDE